ncbi:MAG: hypothetical protein ABEN55_07370 [Bradymonadaceae bacterium]
MILLALSWGRTSYMRGFALLNIAGKIAVVFGAIVCIVLPIYWHRSLQVIRVAQAETDKGLSVEREDRKAESDGEEVVEFEGDSAKEVGAERREERHSQVDG